MEKRILMKRQAAKVKQGDVRRGQQDASPRQREHVQAERVRAVDTLNEVIQALKAITTYDKSALDLQVAALRAVVGLLEPEHA